MSKTTTMTVRLDVDLRDRLEALARGTKRSKSFLAAEAIAEYVEGQAWQLQAIEEGIASADRGELIPHEDIEEWVESWGSDGERPPPEPE